MGHYRLVWLAVFENQNKNLCFLLKTCKKKYREIFLRGKGDLFSLLCRFQFLFTLDCDDFDDVDNKYYWSIQYFIIVNSVFLSSNYKNWKVVICEI